MMVGKDLELPTRAPNESIGDPVLVVDNLTVQDDRGLDAVDGLSITVHAGEVVGIAGVSGNGQRELAQGIVGLMKVTGGSVNLSGADITGIERPSNTIKAGIAYVPQNRLGMGLAPGLDTDDNLALKQFREPPYSNGPMLSQRAFKTKGAELIEEFRRPWCAIRACPSVSSRVGICRRRSSLVRSLRTTVC